MKKQFYLPLMVILLIGAFAFTNFALTLWGKPYPPRPWSALDKKNLPPSIPYKDYTPVVVPNGKTANYLTIDGVKVFHLTINEFMHEVAEGLTIRVWGFNNSVPGPVIEVAQGDKVRIFVTNKLESKTSVHWHGIRLPNGMDGVGGVTQPPIPPGETFLYEFSLPDVGTYLYHSHFDTMVEEGMGMIGMFIVHKRGKDLTKRPDRDFAIMLHEWKVPVGTKSANIIGGDFNIFTMNGKVMPATEPLVAEIGNNVWIRFGNLSAMHNHPIHLHGYSFKVIGTDGGFASDFSVLIPETTVLVPTGSSKVIQFIADNPGDWIFHCHMTHHVMNQMAGNIPFTLGVDAKAFNKKMQTLIPGYKMLGTNGMKNMTDSGLPLPENSIPMKGLQGRWGTPTVFGGMANILRVRKHTSFYKDPGPYQFPPNTEAKSATKKQLIKNQIKL